MDPQTQKGYADSISDSYQSVANQLTAQGRQSEAQQVMRLLQEPTSADSAQPKEGFARGLVKIGLTPQEQVWADRYRQLADTLAMLETRRQAFAAMPSRDAGQNAEYARVQADLPAATSAFQAFLTDLPHTLAPSPTGKPMVPAPPPTPPH